MLGKKTRIPVNTVGPTAVMHIFTMSFLDEAPVCAATSNERVMMMDTMELSGTIRIITTDSMTPRDQLLKATMPKLRQTTRNVLIAA